MLKSTRFIAGSFAVAALIVGACGGDKKESTSSSDAPPADELATDAMASAIQTVLELGATSSASAPDVSVCPLGDFDALMAQAPAELLASASVDGEMVTYVYQPPGEPSHLQCGRGDLGAYTGLTPAAGYKDELIRFLPDFVLTFDDDTAHRGGTIVRFCAEPIGVDAGFVPFCEADWYNDSVWVGVFIYDSTDEAAVAEQWLLAVLDDIVANVPQVAPTVQLVA